MAKSFDLSKGEELLLKAAAIGAAVMGLVSVYNFYKNNIWHPKIEVKNIDYKNGVANLVINGKPFVLRGDSAYLINNDWGIKFGFTQKANGLRVYDRIEVLKRNMVHQVIHKADDAPLLGFTGSEEAIVNNVWGVKSGEGFSIFNDK